MARKHNAPAAPAAAALAAAPAPAVALPTAAATAPASAPASAPAPAVLAAARTSAAQATLWHATNGSTMPPAALPLYCGPTAPKGKQGGPRWQHGTVQQAACAALGNTATVATVGAWCKAHGAGVPGCAAHGAQAGAVGNLRFALGAGVLTSFK